MGYSPTNNPYIPGDPYSYDLKWIIRRLLALQGTAADAEAAAASAAAALGYAERAEAAAAQTPDVPFITPEQFGAVGDGITDDTQAFKDCFSNAGIIVMLREGKNYYITDTINIKSDVYVFGNGATITSSARHLFFNFEPDDIAAVYNGNGNIIFKDLTVYGGSASFIHGQNIVFENCHFHNVLNDHILEICACSDFHVTNCSFKGMATGGSDYINLDPCAYTNFPWLNNAATYDKTPNNNIVVTNCVFENGQGAYATAYNAFGVHDQGPDGTYPNHTNIVFSHNRISDFSPYGVRLNCMDNAVFTDNFIEHGINYALELGFWHQMKSPVIKNNTFVNTAGSNITFVVFRSAGFTDLVFDGNTFAGITETTAPIYCQIAAGSGCTIKKLQPVYSGSSGTTLNIPPDMINRIIVQEGYVSNGTYFQTVIASYILRMFSTVSEQYPLIHVTGPGQYEVKRITLTSTGFTTDAGALTAVFIARE